MKAPGADEAPNNYDIHEAASYYVKYIHTHIINILHLHVRNAIIKRVGTDQP